MSEATVHPSAIVDPGAILGAGTRVWHWVHICGGAVIGRNCSLGQNVFVGNRVRIGDNVKVQNNASIYDNVTVEDDVFCGPSMVFTNVYNPRSAVSRKDEYRDTVVRRGAHWAPTARSSAASRSASTPSSGRRRRQPDVPAFALMVGVPARHIGWMSRLGERLPLGTKGDGTAVCAHTGDRYVLRQRVRLTAERCLTDDHIPSRTFPAWKALEAHAAQLSSRHLRDLFAADGAGRFDATSVQALDLLYDFLPAARHPRNAETAAVAGAGLRPAGAHRGVVRRRAREQHRRPRRHAHGAAQPFGPSDAGGRAGRDAGSARPARQDARVRHRRAPGAHPRLHRCALHRRRQHRHRRLGSRHRDGDGGAGPVPQQGHPPALRVERRRRRTRRRAREDQSRDDAVRHLLQDLHDAGDARQRQRGARVAHRRAGRKRHRTSLRRRVDQPQGDGRVRHRARVALHHVGLGRRALFAVVDGRPVDRAVAGHGPVRAAARRRPRDGRAFPHRAARSQPARADGPARRVEHRLPRPRFTRGPAVRPAPASLSGVPAATRDGIERQERHA